MKNYPYINQEVGVRGINFLAYLYLFIAVGLVVGWGFWANGSLLKKSPEVVAAENNITKIDIENVVRNELAQREEKQIILIKNTPTIYPTYTPLPTYTPFPDMNETVEIFQDPGSVEIKTATPIPVFHEFLDPVSESLVLGREVLIKFSYYWPPYCFTEADPECINCNIVDGVPDCDHVSSGDLWHYEGVGRWMACPADLFGTKWLIKDFIFECHDTGGVIDYISGDSNKFWVDLLYPYAPEGFYWGEEIKAYEVFKFEVDY